MGTCWGPSPSLPVGFGVATESVNALSEQRARGRERGPKLTAECCAVLRPLSCLKRAHYTPETGDFPKDELDSCLMKTMLN